MPRHKKISMVTAELQRRPGRRLSTLHNAYITYRDIFHYFSPQSVVVLAKLAKPQVIVTFPSELMERKFILLLGIIIITHRMFGGNLSPSTCCVFAVPGLTRIASRRVVRLADAYRQADHERRDKWVHMFRPPFPLYLRTR